MVTLHNKTNKKTIQYAFSNAIHECDGNMYIPEMPTVACSSKKDAQRIQNDIATLVRYLSKELIKE